MQGGGGGVACVCIGVHIICAFMCVFVLCASSSDGSPACCTGRGGVAAAGAAGR